MQAANNKGADQIAHSTGSAALLLFAYGINMFSHNMALIRLGQNKKICVVLVT